MRLDEMELHGKKTARPLLFYFLKYAKMKQEQIISNIDENRYKFPHGKIELSIDRIKILEDSRGMRNNGIAKTIRNISKEIEDREIQIIYDRYKEDLNKLNKKRMPIILESIIQTELSYIISIIDNVPFKPSEVIKNTLIPVIDDIKTQLSKVKDLYNTLVKEGVLQKDKSEPGLSQ